MKRFAAGLARRGRLAAVAGLALLVIAAGALVFGLLISESWTSEIFLIGKSPDGNWVLPPVQPMTVAEMYRRDGSLAGSHLYLLGSDAGGRDLLGLTARGALPSLELVLIAVAGRFLVGLAAGIAIGLGARTIRLLSLAVGNWFGGFPYLVLAILLIQVLSPHSRLVAFAVALCLVGWREVAELTASHIESVRKQAYSEAALALGSRGLAYFRRHVLPDLAPALFTELPFQASGVLILVAELGFLNIYLGSHVVNLIPDAASPVAFRLAVTPELAGLLADARAYILREEWAPVLVPAIAVAMLALAFQLVGQSLRARTTTIVEPLV